MRPVGHDVWLTETQFPFLFSSRSHFWSPVSPSKYLTSHTIVRWIGAFYIDAFGAWDHVVLMLTLVPNMSQEPHDMAMRTTRHDSFQADLYADRLLDFSSASQESIVEVLSCLKCILANSVWKLNSCFEEPWNVLDLHHLTCCSVNLSLCPAGFARSLVDEGKDLTLWGLIANPWYDNFCSCAFISFGMTTWTHNSFACPFRRASKLVHSSALWRALTPLVRCSIQSSSGCQPPQPVTSFASSCGLPWHVLIRAGSGYPLTLSTTVPLSSPTTGTCRWFLRLALPPSGF